jgi:hypothetical protein
LHLTRIIYAIMKYKVYFLVAILFVLSFGAKAQLIPNTTKDYGFMGYPTKVHYQKYDTDTNYKQLDKRISFIDESELTFNEDRQLVNRTYFIKGNKDRYSTFTYDINRHLQKEELFEPNGKIVSTITYSYGYLGRLEQVLTVDHPQSLGGANKMVSKETYKWNNKGQITEYSIYGDDASLQTTIQYYYGPQDSLIYTLTTHGYNKNVEKTTYRRDFKYNVIEMTMFRNDSQIRRETYLWNDKNQIVEKKIYNAKNKLNLTYTYTYDEHGFMLSEIAKDKDGKMAIEYYYKYEKDKFFNWTKKITYDGWNPKYIEERQFTYSNKEYFYDDLKDYDTKKVILER